MVDVSPILLLNFFVFLLLPFLCGFIFKRLKLSPLIGYIIGGIILGNFLNFYISKEIINSFAFFGIIFLLFTVGLEINFEKVLILKKFIVAGGLLQIGLSAAFIFLLSLILHFSFLQSLLIGVALSSSSTALVAKIIQDRGEESSFFGELALGILMFQDLAFVPFIILFTFFQTGASAPLDVAKNILFGMVESVVVLVGMYYLGSKVIPVIFDSIAKTSRELLNLFILIFIFIVAYISSILGIPIFISTFIAGVLVSQTSEHYHVFSQIRPFRDLLAIIFFAYIGLNISLSAVANQLPQILLFSFGLIALKFLVLLGIFLCFRFNTKIAFSMALFLFQASENAFILFSLALTKGIFTQDQYITIISAVLISLIATPVLVQHKEIIYAFIRAFFKRYIPSIDVYIKHRFDFDASLLETSLSDHIIICGYGRVGSYIGRALTLSNIPYIAIDYNFHTIQHVRREGVNIIYGDPTDIDILKYANIETANAVVIAVPERYAMEAIILNVKKMNPHITIISRVHLNHNHQAIKDMGAHIVVQPELEASISIIKNIFYLKNVPRDEMVQKIRHLKLENGIL